MPVMYIHHITGPLPSFIFSLSPSGLLPVPKESSFYIKNYTFTHLPTGDTLALLTVCYSQVKIERNYVISLSEESLSGISLDYSRSLLSIQWPQFFKSSLTDVSHINDKAAESIHQCPSTRSSWWHPQTVWKPGPLDLIIRMLMWKETFLFCFLDFGRFCCLYYSTHNF